MKNHFNWLLEDTLEITSECFDWVIDQRPEQYRSKVLCQNRKEILVSSDGWSCSENRATMRYARFQSNIIDIVTLMIYPTAEVKSIPVFAAEYVVINNKVHVIVLDVVSLIGNKQLRGFTNLCFKWKTVFPSVSAKPEWFREIASPQHIFSSSTIEKIADIRAMYNEYLSEVTTIYKLNLGTASFGRDHLLVQNYKKHHAMNSPAKAIIKNENQEWLGVFLNNYHFGTL